MNPQTRQFNALQLAEGSVVCHLLRLACWAILKVTSGYCKYV